MNTNPPRSAVRFRGRMRVSLAALSLLMFYAAFAIAAEWEWAGVARVVAFVIFTDLLAS